MILFDLDGTVLDSAPGIVGALQQAMIDVGLQPADEAALRRDLGPPPPVIFAANGVPDDLLDSAFAAYRKHYLDQGLQRAEVYPGVRRLLAELRPDYRLATATMKLISTAIPFVTHHGLHDHFDVIGGAEHGTTDKAAIIGATRATLGDPDPAQMIMVGDRHSDITGGQQHGLRTIAVTWGYGSREELVATAPDAIIDTPGELSDAVRRLLS